MVLTPDQKKRIAALDAAPGQPPEGELQPDGGVSSKIKDLGLKVTPAQITTVLIKAAIVLAIVGSAAFYVIINDFHKIDFKAVFSPGSGGPIKKFTTAIKEQKEKAELWEEGQGHLLEGEYPEVVKIAKKIENIDPDDPRSAELIDGMVITVTQKADKEFEAGDIEASIKDVEFALKHRKEYAPAKQLYLDISDRLLLEALAHADKKEYEQLIIKAKKVSEIDPANMAAYNLLMETNNELLDSASEHYLLKEYAKALEEILLAAGIDATNPRTLSLLKNIAEKVAAPKLEFYSTLKMHGQIHARIQVPGQKKPKYVKKGDTIENFKVIDIDPKQATIRLRQINTGEIIELKQMKAE